MNFVLTDAMEALRSLRKEKEKITVAEAESALSWPPGILREPGATASSILDELQNAGLITIDRGHVNLCGH